MKFVRLCRTGGSTFTVMTYDKRAQTVTSYFAQVSLVDPWLTPRIERRSSGMVVCGWLFIYFGKITQR